MPHDLFCVVCEEPWDSYGICHGDMSSAEAKAFYQGEGCPACHYGTKQHRKNQDPRPGILARRVQAAAEQARRENNQEEQEKDSK